ncbi:MAG: hypothetical protein ABIK98_10785 [Pseudomonadota bacterium]|uniref:ABC-type transport auxiliary lipoprotein component domain-containing protein n=1 Tax=Candidatus Desulfatibia profunda TaxID=2841695 RepID=A0A8J6NV68_9BACT|nr:hypothetical protein [Candidatus Desulfatibia profunda]MBL7180208.1 hypothetical protein [Desulfobacterales bacterium]MBU0698214.1 hypothetical protein [Pseudomonadota bacterium]
MKPTTKFILLLGSVLMIAVVICACATKSYIDVTYRLPAAAQDFQGKRVFLDCRDMRPDKTIFGEKTKAEFKHFTGLFSLSVNQGEKPFVAGAFDLPSLFKEAFSRRLANLGIDVITRQDQSTPGIEIIIKNFRLNLVDRKWVANIMYEARLLKEDRLLAEQTISGDAERIKAFGIGDAEKVLGDIFSDSVNRLNVRKLFEQALP